MEPDVARRAATCAAAHHVIVTRWRGQVQQLQQMPPGAGGCGSVGRAGRIRQRSLADASGPMRLHVVL